MGGEHSKNRGEHGRGEKEKRRPEKSGEKKGRFRLKTTPKRTVYVLFFFFQCNDKFSLEIFIVNKQTTPHLDSIKMSKK